MAANGRRIKPVTIGYGILAVIFVVVAFNWTLVAVRDSGDQPAPELTEEGRPYADALAEGLQARDAELGTVYVRRTAEQARCIAPDWVMIVGPERWDAAGISPAELAEDPAGASGAVDMSWTDAKRLRRTYERCGAAPIDTVRASIEDGLRGNEEIDPEQVDCLLEKLNAETADRVFVAGLAEPASIAGDQGVDLGIANAVGQCPDH